MKAKFFVSCQPGSEKQLEQEIEEFWHLLIDADGLPTRSRPEIEDVFSGGLELVCETLLGYQINLFSKLALRVLQRLTVFECRYFDIFEKELKKIDLKPFFGESAFKVLIEASKSRLFHESHLKEVVQKVFSKQVQENAEFALYIRFYKDKATLSIDTSGEHLHFRGYRLQQGEAPLRETLAAKMFITLKAELFKQSSSFSLNSEESVLFDPFCGSGTLLFEALTHELPNLSRSYTFESFAKKTSLLSSASWKKNYKIKPYSKFKVLGSEVDLQTFEKLESNFQNLLRQYAVTSERASFIHANCETLDYPKLVESSQNLFLLSNPPYGERLKDNQASKILENLSNKIKLKGALIVHPTTWSLKLQNLNKAFQIPFNNQGLELVLTGWF